MKHGVSTSTIACLCLALVMALAGGVAAQPAKEKVGKIVETEKVDLTCYVPVASLYSEELVALIPEEMLANVETRTR